MATHWTYDPSQLASASAGYFSAATIGQRYNVRLLIQDTNINRKLFYDEEIDWQLTQENNVWTAAASLCDILVSRAGGVTSKSIGSLSLSYDPKLYFSLGGQLRARGSSYQVPYCGGISISDKESQQANTDAVRPSFARGLEQNPGAPQPSIPSPNPLTTT